MTRRLTIAAALVLAGWGAAVAAGSQASHVMAGPGTLKWKSGPASLPAGSEAAVLDGDPAKPGPFTLRIKMPDGYAIAPHWHAADEHVTVIQGTFFMGLGEKVDRSKGHALEAGSFAMMPAGTRHFAWTKGETIVQLHGTGPWGISYVNASDDPRRQEK